MSTPLTVTGFNRQLERLLERSFSSIEVQGEVGQLRRPASGHAYLMLRDKNAVLACVCWRTNWESLAFRPNEGQRVICRGRVGLYPSQGRVQLYITHIRPAGEGALKKKLAEIRGRLAADGLLDPRRKRPLPKMPQVVGLVTSRTGAALADFLRVSRERFPAARIVLAACTVQGAMAASSVVRALELLFEHGEADVIVVTRGGGSREDLLPFQDEQLARWAATSPVPLVSAVGHEIDRCILDEVADAMAPTPSAAAALVLPDGRVLSQRVDEADRALQLLLRRTLDKKRERLKLWERQLRHPLEKIRGLQRRQQELFARLDAAMQSQIRAHKHQLVRAREQLALRHRDHVSVSKRRLVAANARLQALSPMAVLGRGYAVVRHEGRVLRTLPPSGETLSIDVAAGTFDARSLGPKTAE